MIVRKKLFQKTLWIVAASCMLGVAKVAPKIMSKRNTISVMELFQTFPLQNVRVEIYGTGMC